jgi:uncharacterized protein YndB with AHSA1/START domain
MISITLIAADGSRWFAGEFTAEAGAEWLAREKTRPYWDEATQIEIIEIPPPSLLADASTAEEIKD